MKTVAVKKQTHLAELDRLIDLASQPESSRLRLPNRLRDRGALGLEGHIIQLILTWIRNRPDRAIFHTYVADSAEHKGFEDLCQRMFGLCALALSDEIQFTNGLEIARRQALLSAMPSIEAMRKVKFEKAFKGAYVGLPFIRSEHRGKELGEPFYNQGELVGNRKFFSNREKRSFRCFAHPEGPTADLRADTAPRSRKSSENSLSILINMRVTTNTGICYSKIFDALHLMLLTFLVIRSIIGSRLEEVRK